MNLLFGSEELKLEYTTKNYMQLKKTLKAENLRKTLLEAAANGDFETLAHGIKQFAEVGKIKDTDDAYAVIDSAADKQTLFYEFISELGENGFFDKATPEQLREEAAQPNIDIDGVVNKAAAEAALEAMKKSMTTGVNTSLNLGGNA